MNESVHPLVFSGRIVTQSVKTIVLDILPSYVYNIHTQVTSVGAVGTAWCRVSAHIASNQNTTDAQACCRCVHQRFVKPDHVDGSTGKGHAGASGGSGSAAALYGAVCGKAFDSVHKHMHRFLGGDHLEALLRVMKVENVPFLLHQLLSHVSDKLW